MANVEKSENKSKVLVNVYEPLIAIMKHKFDAACLKRDAYLDKALRIEAGFLRDEVKEPNTDRARNFIAENLKELKLKPLSLSLSTETAELITEVCKEKNIPRDSFINRFFLLLIASDTILKALFLFHKGKIEDIEEAYADAEYQCFSAIKNYDQINILDIIEIFSNKSPLSNIRELLCHVYVYPEEWKKKSFHSEFILKKLGDNIWRAHDTMDSVMYEFFGDINADDGSVQLLSIGGYFKWIESDQLWRAMDITTAKEVTTYNHKFEKNCFIILHDDYESIKSMNLLGLNTYMTDDDVSKEEALGRTATLAKSKVDKFFAAIKSEKTKKATPKDATPTRGKVQ